jgi:proteasomal ATPase-associated factor 1
MSLRIYSAVTGVNPRVLRGHSRAITATHILGVGRQVLSASKDGSVRLWNVGAGSEEKAWRLKQPVDALVVVDGEPAAALGAEVVAIAATADGSLTGFSLDAESEEPLFTTPPTDSKLITATYSPSLGLIATGHGDGTITFRRLSNLFEPVTMVRRNEASVYSLAFDGPSLLVGTASGLPARLSISDTVEVEVAEEFAGWEAVGVEAWAVGEGAWCAGADGVLRRY